MVEVRHDVLHAHALLADEIVAGNDDVIEGDECGSCGDLAGGFEASKGDAGGVEERDHDEGQTRGAGGGAAGADGHAGAVGPDGVGDPLFRAGYDVRVAVGGFGGGGGDVGNVTAGARLGDGDAGSFSAGEEVGQEAFLEGFAAEFDEGRNTEGHSDGEGAGGAGKPGACHLVDIDSGVDVVPFFYFDSVEDGVDAEGFEPLDR